MDCDSNVLFNGSTRVLFNYVLVHVSLVYTSLSLTSVCIHENLVRVSATGLLAYDNHARRCKVGIECSGNEMLRTDRLTILLLPLIQELFCSSILHSVSFAPLDAIPRKIHFTYKLCFFKACCSPALQK